MNKSEPREGTVESALTAQLKSETEKREAQQIVARYSLRELCDFVFMKANEQGDRIKISIKPPPPETKKSKKNKSKKKS